MANYAPLQQLATDLSNNNIAQYVVITPDQYNDMHTALSNGFTYNGTHYTGDSAQVAQGDSFLSKLVPQIMASQAYKNNGAIVIWTDETEGTNQNDFNHTLTEIVLSPLAKGNAYASNLNYTHSSDIATMQKIFQVTANTPTGYLNDAANLSNSSGSLAGTAPGFGTGVRAGHVGSVRRRRDPREHPQPEVRGQRLHGQQPRQDGHADRHRDQPAVLVDHHARSISRWPT